MIVILTGVHSGSPLTAQIYEVGSMYESMQGVMLKCQCLMRNDLGLIAVSIFNEETCTTVLYADGALNSQDII